MQIASITDYFVGDVDLDDEKYFTFSWNNGYQNSGFYPDNITDTPDSIIFAATAKFEPKSWFGQPYHLYPEMTHKTEKVYRI